MRLDKFGVTLAMLAFVARLNQRRRAALLAASVGATGASAVIADDREPTAPMARKEARSAAPVGPGLGATKFAGKLRRARTKEVARQQDAALEAALREDAAAAARGRRATFVQAQQPQSKLGAADAIPEDERVSTDQTAWEDAAVELQWRVCESNLEMAVEVGDVHQIRLAISQARDLVKDAPLQRFALADMEDRIANMEPKELAQHASLLWAPEVRRELERFWDVMVIDDLRTHRRGHGRWAKVHSLLVSKRGTVTLVGYSRLYTRISRAMHHGAEPWDPAETAETCIEDWLSDVARFGGSAALNAWFSKVKRLLTARSEHHVRQIGWKRLFDSFDRDNGGSLDCDEFLSGMRIGGKVPQSVATDMDLRLVFRTIDRDRDGHVDAAEFVEWLESSGTIATALKNGTAPQMAKSTSAVILTADAMQEAAMHTVSDLGWSHLFKKFDTNGDGTLCKAEFVTAIREECQLDGEEIADEELWQVFDRIDVDCERERFLFLSFFWFVLSLSWQITFLYWKRRDDFSVSFLSACPEPGLASFHIGKLKTSAVLVSAAGGTICAEEFVRVLSDDDTTHDLVLSASGLHMSLLELADTWAWQKTPQSYASFFRALFEIVAEVPNDPVQIAANQVRSQSVLSNTGKLSYVFQNSADVRLGAMYDVIKGGDPSAKLHKRKKRTTTSQRREIVVAVRQQHQRNQARVALALNKFGNQDIIDDSLDAEIRALGERRVDFGGGVVSRGGRAGLNRVDRAQQARVQEDEGGGRIAFTLKEKDREKENGGGGGGQQLAARAALSPRWGASYNRAQRPQSASGHRTLQKQQQDEGASAQRTQQKRPQSARERRPGSAAQRLQQQQQQRRRPQSARPATTTTTPTNRHAMQHDKGTVRAIARKHGNEHIHMRARPASASSRVAEWKAGGAATKPSASTSSVVVASSNPAGGRRPQPPPAGGRSEEEEDVMTLVTTTGAASSATSSKPTVSPPPPSGGASVVEQPAESKKEGGSGGVTVPQVAGVALKAPFAHAWRTQRATQLERNQMLAKRAKHHASAGPLVGRARAPDRPASPKPDPPRGASSSRGDNRPASASASAGSRVRPASAALASAAAGPRSSAAAGAPAPDARASSPLTAVRPSSAGLRLKQRPSSAGTISTTGMSTRHWQHKQQQQRSAAEAARRSKRPQSASVNRSAYATATATAVGGRPASASATRTAAVPFVRPASAAPRLSAAG